MPRSIIEYFAENEKSKCGYCKKPASNYSHGLWAHSMSVSDYQDLIDRGWRRSGKYCYKPTLDIICCPMYTIRCRALEFKASKSQKKVLKRFNKYLTGEYDLASAERKASSSSEEMNVDESGGELFVKCKQEPLKIDIEADLKYNDSPGDSKCEDTVQPSNSNYKSGSDKIKVNSNTEQGPDPTKPSCKKAKQMRIERKLEKLKAQGKDINIVTNTRSKEKQIEDFIKDLPEETKNKLEIKLVRTTSSSAEWRATANETHAVYVKYQMAIHGDTAEKCTEPKFREFLVQSPLVEEYSEVGPPCGYGSFHQQYRLNGKIIAVGVLDILPKCVSSVYFFYDPQYTNLTMGTYGTLREIEFTRHLHLICPELKYYYMGFYIHSCKKMRYKGAFTPSDLLCPETYNWFPIKDCIPKLEQSPYSRLDPDLSRVDKNIPTDIDINFIPVLCKSQLLSYKVYRKKEGKRNDDAQEIVQYANLVGAKSAKSLILVR
ncbi:arginyl-tRNA--protein transferase 1 isoform X1 [Pieris rapae]|uniref:arginyl-tRNA--protein transferase 1 isoform X1 n=1 Tax=Pieris rapae TaxID=64459 RepID=UPI001E27F91B|nr:arginyl-tRNA--protein transferase 1 isoform X1 [Pieris rapae]